MVEIDSHGCLCSKGPSGVKPQPVILSYVYYYHLLKIDFRFKRQNVLISKEIKNYLEGISIWFSSVGGVSVPTAVLLTEGVLSDRSTFTDKFETRLTGCCREPDEFCWSGDINCESGTSSKSGSSSWSEHKVFHVPLARIIRSPGL